MANKKKLRSFLAGNARADDLLEYNHGSPGSLSDLVNVNRTSRQARLGQTWQDFIVELEALWLDVLDEDPEVYEQAESSLGEIRNTPPEGCRQSVAAVEQLIRILQQATQVDPDFGIMADRMVHLSKELEYICDVFDPNKPQIPGAPIPTRKNWDKTQARLGMKTGETVPGDGQADATYAAHDGQGDDADQVIPGQEPEQGDHTEDPIASKDKPIPQTGANPDAQEFPPGQDGEEQPVPQMGMEPEQDPQQPDMEEPQEQPAVDPEEPKAFPKKVPAQDGEQPDEKPKKKEEPKSSPVTGKDSGSAEKPEPSKKGNDDSKPGSEEDSKGVFPKSDSGEKGGDDSGDAGGSSKPGKDSEDKGPSPKANGEDQEPTGDEEGSEAPETEGIDQAKLKVGTEVEMEHTDDEQEARQIALDHLKEDPEYYDKLDQVMPDEVPGGKTEAQRRPIPVPSNSVVLQGLRAATSSISEGESEVEAQTLSAARTLETAMEEYSDISSALVEVGLTYPGNPPRLDLFVEWTIQESGQAPGEYWKQNKGKKGSGSKGGFDIDAMRQANKRLKSDKAKNKHADAMKAATARLKAAKAKKNESYRSSDCYGYCRLQMTERGLEVCDANDKLMDTIVVTESIHDMDVVDRIYNSLSIAYDVHPKRVFSESAVIGALYRLTERKANGESIPETAFAQVLTSLRPRLGLNEAVGLVSSEIGLKLEEGFEDSYNYYFAWAVKTPLTHGNLPDEIGPDTMKDNPPPPDEDLEYELLSKQPYINSAPKDGGAPAPRNSGLQSQIAHYYEGEHVAHWRTPSIGINLTEKKVYITHASGKREMLDRQKTDEDISARLASMAYQREDVQEGHLIEINRRDRCRVTENAVGTLLEYDLVSMSTEELWDLLVDRGIKVPGDGVTFDREKMLKALKGQVV